MPAHGLGSLPWSPLAMGCWPVATPTTTSGREADSRAALRGGIYADRVSQRAVEAGNQFVRLARDAGMDAAHLAIAWVMQQPAVVAPLIGPKSVEQLEHLLPLMEISIAPDVLAACDQICPPGSAVANFHNSAPWMKMQITAENVGPP